MERFVAFSPAVAYDIGNRMILAGADPKKVKVIESDDPEKVLELMDNVSAKVIYILTNPKHSPEFKEYLEMVGEEDDE